jgi:hypothetical protein
MEDENILYEVETEEVFSVGERFLIKGFGTEASFPFLLMTPKTNHILLVCLHTGLRFGDATLVTNPFRITKPEMVTLTNNHEFTKAKNIKKKDNYMEDNILIFAGKKYEIKEVEEKKYFFGTKIKIGDCDSKYLLAKNSLDRTNLYSTTTGLAWSASSGHTTKGFLTEAEIYFLTSGHKFEVRK